MIEALRARYWSICSELRRLSMSRLIGLIAKVRSPEVYGPLIRLGLAAVQVDSWTKGLFVRHVRNRRLLYLAWLFPPEVSGGVYRPTALFKYGAGRFWQTTVIAGPRPAQPSAAGIYLREQIPPDIAVVHLPFHRVPRSSRKHPSVRLPQIDRGMINVLQTYVQAVTHCRERQPEIIFASGPPFHNFLAASLLARRFRARLILEYRDEWSECPFEFVDKHPENRHWEAWCLTRADLVIFTTQSQLDHQVEQFPNLRRNHCLVVPNGWDPDDFKVSRQSSEKPQGRVIVGFFGRLGAMGDPTNFLNVLAQVLSDRPGLRARFELRVFGQKTAAAEAALQRFRWKECLKLIDQVPKVEACKAMTEVNYLLLLNPPELDRYIPGKLFDYISSGTPIIVYGEGGEAAGIVKKCGAGIVVSPTDAQRLGDILENTPLSEVRSPLADSWLAEHTRERMAELAISALNRVAES